MGHCHYAQLVSKCRELEDDIEQAGISLVGARRSKSQRDVNGRQQTTAFAGTKTDIGTTPKRGTHGDGDTSSLANHLTAHKPGTGCSVYGASNCDEREGSRRAGEMNRETEVCVYWCFVPELCIDYLRVQ